MVPRLLASIVLTSPVACRPAAPPQPPPPASPAPVTAITPAEADPEPREPDDLGPLLAPIVERMQVPGLGAAVVDREGVVALGVAGLRRVDRPEPLRIDDRFHLGSDTKAMTAFVVGRLVDAGALAWDDPLETLLPDSAMHAAYRAVTVDALLTHRGGLPANAEWLALEAMLDPEDTAPQQRAAVARFALRQAPHHAPGGAFLYSNLGYIVLGAALQAHTGEPWEALMQREVFEPLQMRSCGFGPVSTADAPDGSWAHDREGIEYQPVELDNPAYLGPAGTVHCTLPDWGRFAQAMFDDGPGLSAATREHLRTPIEGDDAYARGWLVSDAFPLGETIITHDGSNTVNYASIVIAPRRGLALMTACNAGDAAAQGAAVDAMLTVMKRYGRPAAKGPAR
ncbi:MAG: beta-lactamase family protein [Myxococcales bacterium]|nr:beta-lactamase family protein [Myxococcales bacterium]